MNRAWSWAEIDSRALLHNLHRVRELAPRSKVAAVVKANAYGHGIELVTRVLAEKVDAFAVATCAEGIQARKQDSITPIWVLLGYGDEGELKTCVSHHLTPVIASEHQLNLWTSAGIESMKVIIELDIGMGRMGFEIQESSHQLTKIESDDDRGRTLVLGHFPAAESSNFTEISEASRRFSNASRSAGRSLTLANSAAILAHPFTHLDWVRPGLMLYGISPFSESRGADFDLRPAMRVFSRIRGIRTMDPGQTIGYGSTFRCKSKMRVGLIPFGYADGFPRQEISSSSVAIRDKRCAILGRISMDSMIVDLSSLGSVDVGEPVELWGDNVPLEEIAADSGTIPHHVLTGLGKRVKRVKRVSL